MRTCLRPSLRQGEVEGFVAETVVGHDPAHGDAEADCRFEESDGADGFLNPGFIWTKAMREASSIAIWANSSRRLRRALFDCFDRCGRR